MMTIFAKSNWEKVIVKREFDAEPERVFRAWTVPAEMMKWWGPKGFSCPVCKIDLRVGGEYLICMRSPKGEDYWSKGVYQEISSDKRIVASDSFSDQHGNILKASTVGLPSNWPSTLMITIDLDFKEGKTIFLLIHEGLPPQLVESCRAGWNETLDKLTLLLQEHN